jgi:cell division protein FtsB
MPGRRSTARSSPASTRRRMAQLEQENTRLRQMYLKLSMEHSALQEMVLALARSKIR